MNKYRILYNYATNSKNEDKKQLKSPIFWFDIINAYIDSLRDLQKSNTLANRILLSVDIKSIL